MRRDKEPCRPKGFDVIGANRVHNANRIGALSRSRCRGACYQRGNCVEIGS